MILKDKDIVSSIKLLPIVSIVILMTCIMAVILNMQNNSLKYQVEKIKEKNIRSEKKYIKDKVERIIDFINSELEHSEQSEEKTKEKLLKIISNFTFREKGYAYIVDESGKLLTHRDKNIIGSDAFAIKDPNGLFYMKEGYELAKNGRKGYIEYISITNKDQNWNQEKKLTYVEFYDRFNWAISVGTYISDINEVTQKEIKEIRDRYNKQNELLIVISTVFALLVMGISILLSKRITKIIKVSNRKQDEINRQLAKLVKEKTSKLRHNLGFTHRLINTMPIPVFVKDQEFKYIDCNHAFCDFVGLAKKDIIGKSIYDVSTKEIADFTHKKDQEMIKSDIVYQNYKFVRHEDETKVYEFFKAKFLHRKEIEGILGVIFDITQKELLAKNLKQEVAAKTIQNLKQSKQFEEEQLKNVKFTAIGQLAAGITHEINTPLTYIMGNFEMLGYDIDDLPESDIKTRMKEDSIKINDGLKRIANIIESMREMSQKSKEEKELVNIYHTVATSLTMAYNRSKLISRITINGKEFDMDQGKDDEVYNALIQRQRVEQVWVIIINNALDELVKIDSYDSRTFDITIGYSEDKSEIITKFKDNAGGISEDIIGDIFEPFISSKEYGGMGVGLNVAKKIIEDQSGKISAYNEDDGAVFEVRFKSIENEKH